MYQDLKKKSINFQINVLWKLENVGGLRGNLYMWTEHCLKDRQLRMIIWNQMSGWTTVTNGVS